MSTLDTTSATTHRRSALLAPVGVLAVVAGVIGWMLPDRTVGTGAMDGMSMTHYMGLLAVNQPWNLILFMTCGHCAGHVTTELKAVAGVSDVTVDLVAGGTSTVRVDADHELTDAEVTAALDEAGNYALAGR